MDAFEDYSDLIARFKEASLLASVVALVSWDQHTYMPVQGGAFRAEQLALLARLGHQKLTDPVLGERLAALQSAQLDEAHAANVREIRRVYERATRLPGRLVEEIARVTSQAQQVWADARKHSAFASFQPWLARVVALKREEAEAVGYRAAPYDALLDEYEPGATSAEITRLFAELRAELVPLVASVTSSPRQPRADLLNREFAVDRQRMFGEAAAAAIGFDFNAGRLDTTVHPFCSGIGPGDCRITTRYAAREFNQAFFGILHEAGHGIYEQGLDPAHFGTPLGSHASLGIHESQSRLWENQVGRSQAFWQHFLPRAQQAFPGVLDEVSVDEFTFAVNRVEKSFIRVEADEATYNLHILLRFELEQALLRGDLNAGDVPGAWNERFQQSFGMTPPNDAQGCLQDIHWSMGGLGYFPTYTLGNLYAAQFMAQARRDLGDLDDDFSRGHFVRLKDWLNEKIHRPGSRYRAADLCQRVTGEPLSHRPLMDYLHRKFQALYGDI